MTKPMLCKKCGAKMMPMDHYEYDGVDERGTHEPYFMCPRGCGREEVNERK